MGFLDRLLGREARETYPPPAPPAGQGPAGPTAPSGYAAVPDGAGTPDERAVARYRYLLRTAPPESLEEVHAEAFARLSPEQRRQVLDDLARDLPPGEQPPSEDPRSMARFATRAELRRPGFLEQALGRRPGTGAGGMGMGGTVMGSMMGTVAGVVVGSMLADALLDGYDSSPEATGATDTGATDTGDSSAPADSTDAGDVTAADAGYDSGGFDAGGFGGGDFGGGSDFGGGGDFGGGF